MTDLAAALEHVIEKLIPDAFHNTGQYANNRVECDHGWLKARLWPMRGLKTDRTALVVIRGHAFMQNLRRRPLGWASTPSTVISVSLPRSMNSPQLSDRMVTGLGAPAPRD